MNNIFNAFLESDNPFPIQFVTMNNNHEQETIRSMNGFYHNQILIVTGGTGTLNCNGTSYELKKGSAFFVRRGVRCEYINNGGLKSAYVTVCGNALEDILAHYGCDGFLYYDSIPYESFLADITKMMNEFNTKKRMSLISAMVYEFYLKFFELEIRENYTDLERTVEYIKANYDKKLFLGKIATVYGSSVAKLCRDFKAEYGCTIIQYLLDFRLEIAKSYFKTNSNLRTKEVASVVGFEDASYFCRMYKKKFGVSPLADRDVL